MISENVSSRVTLIPCLARLREMISPTGPAPTMTTSESRDGILILVGEWIGRDPHLKCAKSCGDFVWGSLILDGHGNTAPADIRGSSAIIV